MSPAHTVAEQQLGSALAEAVVPCHSSALGLDFLICLTGTPFSELWRTMLGVWGGRPGSHECPYWVWLLFNLLSMCIHTHTCAYRHACIHTHIHIHTPLSQPTLGNFVNCPPMPTAAWLQAKCSHLGLHLPLVYFAVALLCTVFCSLQTYIALLLEPHFNCCSPRKRSSPCPPC